MNKLVGIILIGLVAMVLTEEIIVEDDLGQQFHLVPVEPPSYRQKRQTNVDIRGGPGGTQVTAGHTGKLFENQNHRLDGGGYVSKQFHPKGPTTLGGTLGYQHKPSGSGLNADVSRTRGFGTDLNVQGNANLWQRGNSRLDATGGYSRHYGGPYGASRPNYNAGLQFSHRF